MFDLWVNQAIRLSPAQSLVLLGLALVAAVGLMYIAKGVNDNV